MEFVSNLSVRRIDSLDVTAVSSEERMYLRNHGVLDLPYIFSE
jgi:hypothetical protein